MKEIQQVVSDKINAMVIDGSIQQMIEEKLEGLVSECISQSMRSYGEFGQALKQAVDHSIGTTISRVSLPEYNKFVAELVTESYQAALKKEAADHLKILLDEQLKPVPTEITAAEILKEIEEYWIEDARQTDHEEIKLDWKQSDSAIYLTIKHPEHDFNSIELSLYNYRQSEGRYYIGYISENERHISGGLSGATHAMGLVGYFYKLYCRETKISGLNEVFGDNIDVGCN